MNPMSTSSDKLRAKVVIKSWQMLYFICASVMVLGHAGDSRAETMDYGSLQSLYGEPVTTSATGTPQRANDSPANLTIITADEIRQSGSRNIPEILSRVPGLDVLQSSNNVFDVGVRGYQQPFQSRLLVLVDGRQVFIDDYSRTIWENIPVNVDDIRQIEIVKGAASALYGSNAAGGVINIVTYSPLYDDNNVANVTVGTQRTVTGEGTATYKGDWGGTKTSIGGLTAEQFNTRRLAGYDAPGEDPFHGYISNNSIFKLGANLLLSTEFNYSVSGGTTDDFIDNGQSAGQTTTTYSFGAGFTWDSAIGQITNNNYYNHSFVQLNEAPTDEGTPYGLTTNLLVSQLQDQFKIGSNNSFRTAFEYRYKDFHNEGFQFAPQSPALSENDFAVSGTWLNQITSELSWTNAARLDYQELAETGQLLPGVLYSPSDYNHNIRAITANSDIVYKPTDVDSFRAGYGRGVQMPSFLQYGFAQFYSFGYPNPVAAAAADPSLGTPVDYEGNPYLKPTYVQDYSADYDRKIDDIFSHIKFSVYYELNQDIVEAFVPSAATFTYNGQPYLIYTPANIGDSIGWGGEIEIKGNHPSGYRWDASYSYSRVADQGSVGDFIDYQGSAPMHHLRLLLGYSTGSWEFDLNGQLVTSTNMLRGTPSEIPVATGGYETLSGRIGYKLTDKLTAALSGMNLNNNTLMASPYPAVQRQIFLSLTGKL